MNPCWELWRTEEPIDSTLESLLSEEEPLFLDLDINVQTQEEQDNTLDLSHYYRHLGLPIFFLSPALSTVPLSVGHDNQRQRDLLRDLGPIHRWWCSKHCLLKAESIASFSSYLLFISDLFLLLSAWLCHISPSCHHAYTFVSAQLTHPLSLVIMLTLICHSRLLLQTLPSWPCSPYMQPHSPYLLFPFILLPALNGPLLIYTGLLPLIYLNLDLYQSTCWSIFSHFEACCFWKPFHLTKAGLHHCLLSFSLQMRLHHHLLLVNRCWPLLTHCLHDSASVLAVGSWSPYPWP